MHAVLPQRYTEGITLLGTGSASLVLLVNRAMAHRRREDWVRCLEDALMVLSFDERNMKVNIDSRIS